MRIRKLTNTSKTSPLMEYLLEDMVLVLALKGFNKIGKS